MFVREAEYEFPVKLFKLEGWKAVQSREGVLPDIVIIASDSSLETIKSILMGCFQVIPLVERAEIGRIANATLFKNIGKSGMMCSARDVRDALKDKDFHYTPLDFNVQMTFANLSGNNCERNFAESRSGGKMPNVAGQNPNEVPAGASVFERDSSTYGNFEEEEELFYAAEESIPFDRIVIANMPSAEDPTFPANPQDPWLEVYAKVAETKTKPKNRYSFLVQEPLQHVNKMTVTSARDDQFFRVIVDGEFFGGFHTIRVSPIEDSDRNHISMPFKTFFPIVL